MTRQKALIAALQRDFKLSPSEARIAASLSEGASPKDAAVTLNVTVGTVRTVLKTVFLKTDTNRQAALVALMAWLVPLTEKPNVVI